MINRLGWKKGLLYSAITAVVTLALFALVFDIITIQHLLNSVDLFIQKFEFNASVYYFVRWIGTIVTGYNIIAIAGPLLILLSTCIILYISLKQKKNLSQGLITKALFIITIWYFFATTVHPWYVCLPMAISIFTHYRYALVWSYATTLSYYSYQFTPVKENLCLVAFSYLLVMGYAFWELRNRNNKMNNIFQQKIS